MAKKKVTKQVWKANRQKQGKNPKIKNMAPKMKNSQSLDKGFNIPSNGGFQ